MISFVTCLLLVAAFLAANSEVLVLDHTNFTQTLEAHPRILVEFYAPWCGHCQALEPEYNKLDGMVLNDNELTVAIAKLDASASENDEIAQTVGIEGFPTLVYFTNGNVENGIKFEGDRTAQGLFAWLQQRQLPAFDDLTDKDATFIKEYLTKSNIVVIGVFESSQTEYTNDFTDSAELLRDTGRIGLITADGKESLLTELGIEKNNVYLFKDKGNEKLEYGDMKDFDMNALIRFVENEKFSTFGEISYENFYSYQQRGLPIVWVGLVAEKVEIEEIYDENNEEVIDAKEHITPITDEDKKLLDEMISFFSKIAKDYKDSYSFGWTNANNADTATFLKDEMGMTKFPGVVFFDVSDEKNDIYPFVGDVKSETDVRGWIEKFGKGELEKYIKTQEAPEVNPNDYNIWELVGSTVTKFRKENLDKDLIIEYYANWCPYCQSLEPLYFEIGNVFKPYNEVVFARIDASLNDFGGETVEGFPTIYLYPKGSNDGVLIEAADYNTETGYSKDYLVWFIKNNGGANTDGLPMPDFTLPEPPEGGFGDDYGDMEGGDFDGDYGDYGDYGTGDYGEGDPYSQTEDDIEDDKPEL